MISLLIDSHIDLYILGSIGFRLLMDRTLVSSLPIRWPKASPEVETLGRVGFAEESPPIRPTSPSGRNSTDDTFSQMPGRHVWYESLSPSFHLIQNAKVDACPSRPSL